MKSKNCQTMPHASVIFVMTGVVIIVLIALMRIAGILFPDVATPAASSDIVVLSNNDGITPVSQYWNNQPKNLFSRCGKATPIY